MIKLNNATISFDKKLVIDKLNFEFKNGNKYAITGESGCGKTTLLNAIAGLLKPQSGEIFKAENCRIAYVFQEPRLFDWLTVKDNVMLVIGLNKVTAEKKAEEILSNLGLSDSIDLYPHELSGGMKQRVAIARALAYDPNLLLLDEPFKALDEETKKKTAEYVFEYLKGKMVIMVTHDQTDLDYVDVVLKAERSPINSFDLVKSSI